MNLASPESPRLRVRSSPPGMAWINHSRSDAKTRSSFLVQRSSSPRTALQGGHSRKSYLTLTAPRRSVRADKSDVKPIIEDRVEGFMRRYLAVLAVLVLFASLPLFAQTVTGTMNGTVTDRSGGALPGVTVTVRNLDTGLERVLVTDANGFFNAPFHPVGRYFVSADLAGFGNPK